MAEANMASEPQNVHLPRVFERDGVIWTNSRDVAACFGKEHKNVLRDVGTILHGSDLSDEWFQEVTSEHPTVAGRQDRSFDMTRDGFTVLVMGYTGARAMAFKLAYIKQFNAMEATLRNAGAQFWSAERLREVRLLLETTRKIHLPTAQHLLQQLGLLAGPFQPDMFDHGGEG